MKIFDISQLIEPIFLDPMHLLLLFLLNSKHSTWYWRNVGPRQNFCYELKRSLEPEKYYQHKNARPILLVSLEFECPL